jgi:hypothetical protein
MKIIGTSLLSVHLFALVISILTLLAIYMLALHQFDFKTALISVLFLFPQAIFLAQSTLLLPEMLLALLTILSIDLYFNNKWLLFSIVTSLLLLTKETGIVLVVAFFLHKLFIFKLSDKKSFLNVNHFKELLIICLPLLPIMFFLTLQKLKLGWFFYPEHMGMIQTDLKQILKSLGSLLTLFFTGDGRLLILIALLVSLIFLTYKKRLLNHEINKLLFFMVFILLYLIFSSINFFTVRYLLSILTVFGIAGAFLISKLFEKNNILLISCSGFIILVLSYMTIKKNNESDVSVYFSNSVKLHKEVVNYCETQDWHSESISTGFLMSYNLSRPFLGYLNDKTNIFQSVSGNFNKNSEIFIFYSNESDPNRQKFISNKKYDLIKRFEKGNSWAEIYIENKLYKDDNPGDKSEELYNTNVRDYISKIKSDKEWLKKIEKKAKEKNIPLDSMIKLDAIWMVENNDK